MLFISNANRVNTTPKAKKLLTFSLPFMGMSEVYCFIDYRGIPFVKTVSFPGGDYLDLVFRMPKDAEDITRMRSAVVGRANIKQE